MIHNQIKEPEKIIRVLSEVLSLDEAKVRARVEKVSSIERIKANVDKALGDKIREYKLDGVMVDEKRVRAGGHLGAARQLQTRREVAQRHLGRLPQLPARAWKP